MYDIHLHKHKTEQFSPENKNRWAEERQTSVQHSKRFYMHTIYTATCFTMVNSTDHFSFNADPHPNE